RRIRRGEDRRGAAETRLRRRRVLGPRSTSSRSAVARKAYFQFTDRVLSKLCTAIKMKVSINRMMPAGRDPSLAIRSQDSVTCYELEQPSTASM
uniref:Uncharacterized protein n=1 Tax=Aegilops tauschii subsp. strangulata TaxID=200361 RepID=A0A453GZ24_AEGTS